MKRYVIDSQGVLNNLAVVKERSAGAAIYAVLTADAYGAGLLEMAKLLRDHGVTRFALSEPGEVRALRRAGFVEEEILMLRSTANRSELEELMDLGAVCAIGSAEAGMALNALAESRSTIAEAQVQVDSGMGYGGFVATETDKILSVFQNLQSVAISGMFTQLASGKGAQSQLEDFEAVVEAVRSAGFETGVLHGAGSYTTLHGELGQMDAVRLGSALLGRCKRTRDDALQRVGYCEATVEDVRWLPGGHSVGYEQPVRLKKPTRVATIAVGYQNGLGVTSPRGVGLLALLRRWRGKSLPGARLNGKKVRIIGGVGAMETLIDVTDVKCAPGDWARLEMDPLYAKGMPREYR